MELGTNLEQPDASGARALIGHPSTLLGVVGVEDLETEGVLDSANGRVLDSFRGGDGAFQALRAFGSMWVTSYAGADVWRFRT